MTSFMRDSAGRRFVLVPMFTFVLLTSAGQEDGLCHHLWFMLFTWHLRVDASEFRPPLCR